MTLKPGQDHIKSLKQNHKTKIKKHLLTSLDELNTTENQCHSNMGMKMYFAAQL